jgi:hypothetical protein
MRRNSAVLRTRLTDSLGQHHAIPKEGEHHLSSWLEAGKAVAVAVRQSWPKAGTRLSAFSFTRTSISYSLQAGLIINYTREAHDLHILFSPGMAQVRRPPSRPCRPIFRDNC